jgi:unconventional prefoldin RPB5 interactor 1
MLQYGLSEVGAVVAELNLEEDTDEDYEDYTDDTTDDEDEYGRSTGKVVDNEMRQRMIELEDRLGVRSMQNMGKKSSDIDIVQEGVGRITINHRGDAATSNSKEIENLSSAKSDSPAYKKSVRFSEELDISPTPESAPAPTPTERRAAPVGDIRERTAPVQVTTIPGPLKIQSHFQSSRAASATVTNGPLSASITGQTRPSLPLSLGKPLTPETFSQRLQFSTAFDNSQTVPTGPEGKTLAPQVVERDIPVNASPGEPDDEDPQLLHQLVATEYHRMRNRMIQRQGGFLKEEETEIVPLTEEEGGPKKMSRFKAARLAKS